MAIGSPTSPPYPEPAPFVVRRFTVEEYRRMAETGVLTDEDRVELLEGVITPKMIHNPPHDTALTLVEEALRACLRRGWFMRLQSSMATADSQPEPDIAIVRGHARDYARRHPAAADIGLVVEIAHSSLLRDRNKARVYARAKVPVYWIVNLSDAQVEVYEEPSGPSDEPAYRRSASYRRGDKVPVNFSPETQRHIPVDDLLP